MAQHNGRRGQGGGNSGNRGFAAMNQEEQREIARKGGEAVSRDREHMSEIGRKGAEARKRSHPHPSTDNLQGE